MFPSSPSSMLNGLSSLFVSCLMVVGTMFVLVLV